MRIGVITGSHRAPSETARIGAFVTQRLAALGCETWVFSLAHNPLPLWDPGVWSGAEPWPTVWKPVADELAACDGFVVLAPEWGGMVPPGLKNLLLLCGNRELAHKPALPIGVSSGMGGAYPLAELRVSGTKNNHLVWIPEQLAIRNCTSLFVDDEPSETDAEVRERLDYALGMLIRYADALEAVRNDPFVDHAKHPYGM